MQLKGKVEQIGTPEDIYLRPRTRFVAEFLGAMNWFNVVGVRPEATCISKTAKRAAHDPRQSSNRACFSVATASKSADADVRRCIRVHRRNPARRKSFRPRRFRSQISWNPADQIEVT